MKIVCCLRDLISVCFSQFKIILIIYCLILPVCKLRVDTVMYETSIYTRTLYFLLYMYSYIIYYLFNTLDDIIRKSIRVVNLVSLHLCTRSISKLSITEVEFHLEHSVDLTSSSASSFRDRTPTILSYNYEPECLRSDQKLDAVG